jgi:hypothetical protein
MKELKISFVDFWVGFDNTNNYFYNLLVQKWGWRHVAAPPTRASRI